jgi:hypothetical protein
MTVDHVLYRLRFQGGSNASYLGLTLLLVRVHGVMFPVDRLKFCLRAGASYCDKSAKSCYRDFDGHLTTPRPVC